MTGQTTIRLGSVHGTAELWTMHEHAQLSVLVFFLSGHWFRTATTDGFTTPCQVATLSRVYEVVDAPCLVWLADDALPNLFAPIPASGSAFRNCLLACSKSSRHTLSYGTQVASQDLSRKTVMLFEARLVHSNVLQNSTGINLKYCV